ncbi:hypothetical protein PR003_g228 [Phytophthora rubi]|uniref:Uncharacterized protein n=1 Tax=Phytophthora rubi TaxID=129364 RepID=A0A6A3P0U4_9STRA|nr:hypothetical protein PR002_g1429 [Phytophthora rubi]KAE9051565.1 hypothetical protein PR001_g1328 [Phytophthora rubi]KAE9360385.1 hypothetical protein PR003_g228 [Phytophthora rubi]
MKGMATMSLTKGFKCMATLNPTMTDMKGMATLSLTKGLRLTKISPRNPERPRSIW